MKYAEVALNLPINKTFHYRVPSSMAGEIEIGKRVWVPFGKRRMVGYIVSLTDSVPPFRVRDVEKIIDEEPILPEELMKLARWMSDYYCTSLGNAIEAAVPAPLKRGKTSVKERKAEIEEKYTPTSHLKPTSEQAKAITEIKDTIERGVFQVFLLHGITSSGKTEVYLQCISDVIDRGKSAIVLIPEISLTPQAAERFKSRFGERVAVIHSQMTGGRRFRDWQNIKEGSATIVVGARSALFSPVRDLGLIVVDEEHEWTYKQGDQAPRYHARMVAERISEETGATLVLGSATPDISSYRAAKSGNYRLLELPDRVPCGT